MGRQGGMKEGVKVGREKEAGREGWREVRDRERGKGGRRGPSVDISM